MADPVVTLIYTSLLDMGLRKVKAMASTVAGSAAAAPEPLQATELMSSATGPAIMLPVGGRHRLPFALPKRIDRGHCRTAFSMSGIDDDAPPPGWEPKGRGVGVAGLTENDPPVSTDGISGLDDNVPVCWKIKKRCLISSPDEEAPPPGWEPKKGDSMIGPAEKAPLDWDCSGRNSASCLVDDAPSMRETEAWHRMSSSAEDAPPGWEPTGQNLVSDQDDDIPPGWEPNRRYPMSSTAKEATLEWQPNEKNLMSDLDEDAPPGWEPKARCRLSSLAEEVPPGWEPMERDPISGPSDNDASGLNSMERSPVSCPETDVPPAWEPNLSNSSKEASLERGQKESNGQGEVASVGPDPKAQMSLIEESPLGCEAKERSLVSGQDEDAPPRWEVKETIALCGKDKRVPPGWEPEEEVLMSSEAVPPGWELKERNVQGSPDEDAPPGWELKEMDLRSKPEEASKICEVAPPQSQLPAPHSPIQSPEMGQMVCGSCRQLLSHPSGAKYVQCACCQTINLVLEAFQVGNVICGKCSVLLMYPYGAPSVRCSSCCCVTKIDENNIRPPVSVQQGHLQ